jgi:hypothetical protein
MTVIIMDIAPYHNRDYSKPLEKQEMMDWLQADGLMSHISVRKLVLYIQIDLKKHEENLYRIDQQFHFLGHVFMRLLPHMCDLNSIELAWIKGLCKHEISWRNIPVKKLNKLVS